MFHSGFGRQVRGFSHFLLAIFIGLMSFTVTADDSAVVQAEVVEINPTPATKDASTLWKETKQKTGEAASSAAEYSKVQGGKILEAGKTGVAKGADAVSSGSSKAWDATKKATKSAVQFTGQKATQAGAVIADVVKSDDTEAPVSDKSIGD